MSQKTSSKASSDKKSAPQWLDGAPSNELASYWLAAIIESAEDAIISKTLEGVITSWNKGAERIFGYTADEIIGKPVTTLIPADHLDEEPGIIRRIKKGERIEHYDTVRVGKGGRLINISLTVSPIKAADGKIIGASKIVRDITERKIAEQKLQEALQQAEEANRLKDEFLATISHELRTPLTSMMGWIWMIRAGKLDNELREKALASIERNVKSQAQLIEDLLDISSIANGKMNLKFEPVQLWSVVNAGVDAIRPAAEAKNIRLKTVVDSGAGEIFGDFDRLQQVVWNLLSNAVKFTPEGGEIIVQLEKVDSILQLSVTDNGKGIEPEFLPRIFERFSQADSSTTRGYGGMGLGLSIVKAIVELHGGSVRAKSEGEGKGATFTVSFPISSNGKGDVKRLENLTERVAETVCPKELSGLKLLIVDDELDTCEMIGAAFKQCGTIVKFATSVPEALLNLEKWLPDLVIADISMPEMDGYELIRLIRERKPSEGKNIPAIALTAMARIEDRIKALNAGFQMHVAKPVELRELLMVAASLANIVEKES